MREGRRLSAAVLSLALRSPMKERKCTRADVGRGESAARGARHTAHGRRMEAVMVVLQSGRGDKREWWKEESDLIFPFPSHPTTGSIPKSQQRQDGPPPPPPSAHSSHFHIHGTAGILSRFHRASSPPHNS